MKVPFVELKAQAAALKGEVLEAFGGIIDRTGFILGPEVERFEAAFAEYSGCPFGVGVNSGTSAIHLALVAMGVGPGDEVVTVPNTFIATVEAISMAGAKPVLVDVDPVTFNMDPTSLAAAISDATKAIIPVHLYGQTADMDPILELAGEHGIAVIEDACQAHGATYKGRPAGSLGNAGCFSFYPTKNLGAFGEGGIVVTGDEETAQRMKWLRDHGQCAKHDHGLKGLNYRMEAFQGAVLGIKLGRLEGWNEARRAAATRYEGLLAGCGLELPIEVEGRRHVYHLYVVRAGDRDGLMSHLAEVGIGSAVHYPVPIHLQESYRDLGYRVGSFPVAERLVGEILSLPMFPEMDALSQEAVARAVKGFTG